MGGFSSIPFLLLYSLYQREGRSSSRSVFTNPVTESAAFGSRLRWSKGISHHTMSSKDKPVHARTMLIRAWKTLRQRALLLLLFVWLLIVMTYFTPRYRRLLRLMGRSKGGEAWPERWRSSGMRMWWFDSEFPYLDQHSHNDKPPSFSLE